MNSNQELLLRVGNTAEPTDDGKYRWKFFVQPDGPAAAHVNAISIDLHPTFEPRSRSLVYKPERGAWTSGNFVGWGTFSVGVTVGLTDMAAIKLEHQLSFDAPETSTQHSVQIPSGAGHGNDTEDSTVADVEQLRRQWQQRLAEADFLEPNAPEFKHGRAFVHSSAVPPQPKVTWRSRQKPRADHEDAAQWLTASEFTDTKSALDVKCRQLGELLRLSKKTVVYSGAGLSVAAGIGQAARGAAKGGKSTDASPTYAHYALGALYRRGLLHGWVQQNHDGLPQKAGVGQEAINEIHGSWYDPSNPVVKYSGTLKGDCYPDMRAAADSADLVIVIGSTLGGLNADQVATKTAGRSCSGREWDGTKTGGALGTVIINLQQTEQDGKATLRLFGKADDVLRRLLPEVGIDGEKLGIAARMPWLSPPKMPLLDIPYDKNGRRVTEPCKNSGRLDLRVGAKIQLSDDHNVQGAQQPAYMHIGASPGTTATNGRKAGPGFGVVKGFCRIRSAYVLEIEGVQMLLGVWWAHAAAKGTVNQLPVLNA